MRLCKTRTGHSRAAKRFAGKTVLMFALVFAIVGSTAGTAFAGFGITPPYVDNQRLARGSVYEQKIILVRSDPTDDLKAEITTNVPGAQDWISVDRGNTFILPAGSTQVPIVVTVKVPANAEFKQYKGAIRVRTSSAGNQPKGGGVSIALGAQIDVDLRVVDKIFDFNVRQIRIADLEVGRMKWGLFFPGKIRFFMTIENTGNADFGPTKVKFDIYDAEKENLLETTYNTNRIESIPPFAIKEVISELPTRLPAGRYVAKYTIYKNDEIAQENEVNLSVAAVGAVPGYTGYGFGGLSLKDKFKVFGVVGVPAIFLIVLIFIIVQRSRRRRQMRQR